MKILTFTTGAPTVVDPSHIDHITRPTNVPPEGIFIAISDDEEIWIAGDFRGFNLYVLVTHRRPEVVPGSVHRISNSQFGASLRLESPAGTTRIHELLLRAPLQSYRKVKEATYGSSPDGFSFSFDGTTEPVALLCDLAFLVECAEQCPQIPLKVEYIGVAKAPGREAQDRLRAGHEKLRHLISDQAHRPKGRTTSILLYRLEEAHSYALGFEQQIEALEATMIAHFKPLLNKRRSTFPADSPDLCRLIKEAGAAKITATVEAPANSVLYSDEAGAASLHHITISL